MATPTTTQVRDLRADVSDITTPLLLGYSEVAALYDRAEGVYNLTVVYALQRVIARLTSLYSACEGKDARIALEKRIAAARALLDYWKMEAGIFGGALTSSYIALELDTVDDYDLE